MSVNGAVYQPTTVTYESQEEHAAHHQHHHAGGGSQSSHWAQRPISYIAASVSQAARRPCGISCVPLQTVLPVVYLTSAIATFAIGLTMLIHGVIGYVDMPPTASEAFYVSVAVIGALLLVAGGLFVALFLRHTRRSCFRAGKDHLDTSGAGAQALTVNPSTDLLVAAQYAPVSEVAYQPPSDESEQSKLMPQENKEIVDDTDRMLESDPRIVLRPLQQPNTSEDA